MSNFRRTARIAINLDEWAAFRIEPTIPTAIEAALSMKGWALSGVRVHGSPDWVELDRFREEEDALVSLARLTAKGVFDDC